MRPGIDKHDYDHKVKHAKEFIEHGDKVKFTIMFRGREIVHAELGYVVIRNIEKDFEDIALIEKEAAKEGRNLTMIMGPLPSSKSKSKSKDS